MKAKQTRLPLTLVLDNIRSAHNVGSIFRTADAAGAQELILVGLTPYPPMPNDRRLPHVAQRANRAIAKTALGAELAVPFRYFESASTALEQLAKEGNTVYALEQHPGSANLFTAKINFPACVVLGHEREGLSQLVLDKACAVLEIPMTGEKESLNVSVTAGIAAYQLRELWLNKGIK